MDYTVLSEQLAALAAASPRWLPLTANASALLWQALPRINWAGFYLAEGETLLLGPFQGKPACVTIEKGRGVCGTAFARDETQVVADVHAFPGHIACDAASRSEIVVPVHREGTVAAVLDIDSPEPGRFTGEDRAGLEAFVRELERVIEWEDRA